MAANHQLRTDAFTEFVKEVEGRLQHALIARHGLEVGRESAAEAFAYAWEHWDRLQKMVNPAGYLFRVATSRSRRLRKSMRVLPEVSVDTARWVEPGLPSTLGKLSPNQRVAVLLVHSFEYTHAEAADVMGIATGSLRKHLSRGMAKLRRDLEVDDEG